MATLYTIGFTKKTAENFFTRIRTAGITKVIDIRLNNVSQLAGFAKRDDLAYFLRELCECDYRHMPILTPTKAILEAWKKKQISWADYEKLFGKLVRERKIEDELSAEDLDNACLLCSEPTAAQCHRRLVAEHLQSKLSGIEIVHL